MGFLGKVSQNKGGVLFEVEGEKVVPKDIQQNPSKKAKVGVDKLFSLLDERVLVHKMVDAPMQKHPLGIAVW